MTTTVVPAWALDPSIAVVVVGASAKCERLLSLRPVYRAGDYPQNEIVMAGRVCTVVVADRFDLTACAARLHELGLAGATVRCCRIPEGSSIDEYIDRFGSAQLLEAIDGAPLAHDADRYVMSCMERATSERAARAEQLLGDTLLLAMLKREGDIGLHKVRTRLAPVTSLGRDGQRLRDAVDAYAAATAEQKTEAEKQRDTEQQARYAAHFDIVQPFTIEDGHFSRLVYDAEEETYVGDPFTNFTAHIVSCRSVDDGTGELNVDYTIEGTLEDGRALPRIVVPVDEFASMHWLLPNWPRGPIVRNQKQSPGDLGIAIRKFSSFTTEHINARIGWKEFDGRWVYLTGSGAVGGDASIKVELPGALKRFDLAEPDAATLADDIRVSLRFQGLRGDVTRVLGAACYCSVLGELLGIDWYIWIYGKTRAGKSNLQGCCMMHFGGFSFNCLPASFHGTTMSVSRQLSMVHDSCLAVDNYLAKTANQKQVIALLHSLGDRQGRTRLRRDGSMQEARDVPHSLMIASGEEAPPDDEGALGRGILMHVSRLEHGAFETEKAYANSSGPALNRAMSAFIRWLQPRMSNKAWRAELIAEVEAVRAQHSADLPGARDPGKLAHLVVGLRCWNRFAADAGVTHDGEPELVAAFKRIAGQQVEFSEGTSHADKFMDGLNAAFDRRQVCLIPRGYALSDFVERGIGGARREAIGWYDEGAYYLDPVLALDWAAKLDRDWKYGSRNGLYQSLVDIGLVAPDDKQTAKGVRVGAPDANGRKRLKRVLMVQRTTELIHPALCNSWTGEAEITNGGGDFGSPGEP